MGVVRWRHIDLVQRIKARFSSTLNVRTVGRLLRALDFRRIFRPPRSALILTARILPSGMSAIAWRGTSLIGHPFVDPIAGYSKRQAPQGQATEQNRQTPGGSPAAGHANMAVSRSGPAPLQRLATHRTKAASASTLAITVAVNSRPCTEIPRLGFVPVQQTT